MMHYWRLRVNPAPNADYNVYYKTPIDILAINIPRNAVVDGDLLGAFMRYVDVVEEVTAEQYYEHMID